MFFPVWVFWTKQKSGNPGSGHSKLSNVAEQCGGQSPVNVKLLRYSSFSFFTKAYESRARLGDEKNGKDVRFNDVQPGSRVARFFLIQHTKTG
jgi:hypothetical protein